jgi:Domain of Unknown Function (DUF1521)
LGRVYDQLSSLLDRLSQQLSKFESGQGFQSGQGGCCCPSKPAPIPPPSLWDNCNPRNSLKTEGNVITTPGGYKIEMQGQFDWKITGPDGKKTEIWGDPHVRESDGGAWDFKRNSIFKLPDGTEIKCNTVPYANGMTVTGSLDITNGHDRIQVSGIDKGIGQIGPNTGDGMSARYGNSISGLDTFVMGKESDDWALTGKEVIGSNNGGDSFRLGNELAAGNSQPQLDNWQMMIKDLVSHLTNSGFRSVGGGFDSPFHPHRRPPVRDEAVTQDTRQDTNVDRNQLIQNLRQDIRRLSRTVNVLSRFANLTNSMNGFRNRGFYA